MILVEFQDFSQFSFLGTEGNADEAFSVASEDESRSNKNPCFV
jgi:hypothetical protein